MLINGLNYYSEEYSSPRWTGKKTLLMFHGFTGSSRNWEKIAIQLAPATYTIHCIDLPGHGSTDAPHNLNRYQFEQVVSDLKPEFSARGYRFEGAGDLLLGYSMGGRFALYWAITYPDSIQALILESASPGLKTEDERAARRAADEKLAQMIERDGIEAFVNYWESLPLWDSQQNLAPEVRQQLRAQRLKNNPVGLANSLRGMGTGAQPSLWDKLPQLNLPVLLIVGELDTKFVAIAHEMHGLLPNSRLVIIPNAGHTVHLEQPERYTQAVTEFLGTL